MSSAGFSPPSMNWEAPNVEKEFRHFKQYCELIFDGPFCNKSKKERISFILLWIEGLGVDIYNSWSWEDDDKKAKPEEILGRFEQHLAPKARYQLQQYRQKRDESLADYITRCRNQATKCKFRYVKELGERLIEQLIIGTKHRRVQGKLLENNESLCLDDAIDIARNYEMTHSNLEQLLSPVDQDVHLIKQSRYERQSRKACNNCGKTTPMTHVSCMGNNLQQMW